MIWKSAGRPLICRKAKLNCRILHDFQHARPVACCRRVGLPDLVMISRTCIMRTRTQLLGPSRLALQTWLERFVVYDILIYLCFLKAVALFVLLRAVILFRSHRSAGDGLREMTLILRRASAEWLTISSPSDNFDLAVHRDGGPPDKDCLADCWLSIK